MCYQKKKKSKKNLLHSNVPKQTNKIKKKKYMLPSYKLVCSVLLCAYNQKSVSSESAHQKMRGYTAGHEICIAKPLYVPLYCTYYKTNAFVCTMQSVSGKSFLWYRLNCHKVFVEIIFCSFIDAYKIIDVFVLVRFYFLFFAPKKKSSKKVYMKNPVGYLIGARFLSMQLMLKIKI